MWFRLQYVQDIDFQNVSEDETSSQIKWFCTGTLTFSHKNQPCLVATSNSAMAVVSSVASLHAAHKRVAKTGSSKPARDLMQTETT